MPLAAEREGRHDGDAESPYFPLSHRHGVSKLARTVHFVHRPLRELSRYVRAVMSYLMTMEGALLRIRMYDTLSSKDLLRLAEDVIELEATFDRTPWRLTDMTGIRHFRVGFRDMLAFAERRKDSPPRQPIRSALLVDSHVQYGFGRMFQTLNDHPLVRVEIFRDLSEALGWLEVARD